VCRLESTPAGHGEPATTLRELVAYGIRMRPDRLIVGEVRGAEALDLLQAMNTGHEGSMSTIHANSPRDALARLETLTLMAGYDLPLRAIRRQIVSAIQVVVHLARRADGSRKVISIAELTGMEDPVVGIQDIFVSEVAEANGRGGTRLQATGIRPRVMDRVYLRGVRIPELSQLFPEHRVPNLVEERRAAVPSATSSDYPALDRRGS
jgi:pilus assembly protein CpaF